MQKAVIAIYTLITFSMMGVSVGGAPTAYRQITQGISKILQNQKLEIKGNKYLKETAIEKLLPEDRSIFWWLINKDSVEKDLLKNALISSANIKKDPRCWLGCYTLTIKERIPTYVVFLNSQAWIVGNDGHFILPIPGVSSESQLDKYLKVTENKLILISGVVDPSMSSDVATSPDFTKARISYINSVVPVIESEVRRSVKSLTMAANGELEVVFNDITPKAVFEYNGDDLSHIGKSAKRFFSVLQKFAGREGELKQVDLAYDKLAVLKLK